MLLPSVRAPALILTVYVAPWVLRFEGGSIVMVLDSRTTYLPGIDRRMGVSMAGVLILINPADPNMRSVSNEMTILVFGATAEAPWAGWYP